MGAAARYVVDLVVTARAGQWLPWGTLVVNLFGSGLLGVLSGLAAAGIARPAVVVLVGVGFCGGFTTTSALAWEVVALMERGRFGGAIGYAVVSVTCGVALAAGGFIAVRFAL